MANQSPPCAFPSGCGWWSPAPSCLHSLLLLIILPCALCCLCAYCIYKKNKGSGGKVGTGGGGVQPSYAYGNSQPGAPIAPNAAIGNNGYPQPMQPSYPQPAAYPSAPPPGGGGYPGGQQPYDYGAQSKYP